MLLRDRLQALLAEMGERPDYVRLAAEVLAIRNAPEPIARKLVAQALVIEDRRDAWTRVGDRVARPRQSGRAFTSSAMVLALRSTSARRSIFAAGSARILPAADGGR